MNKIKSLISAFAFLLLTTASFANDIGTATLDDLRKEIATHLSKLDVSDLDEDTITMNVKFVVNDKNEVIVLSVDDKEFDTTIKSKLNYKKLNTEGVTKNTVIAVPVTFKK